MEFGMFHEFPLTPGRLIQLREELGLERVMTSLRLCEKVMPRLSS